MRTIFKNFPRIFSSVRSINAWSAAKPVDMVDRVSVKEFKNYLNQLPVVVTNSADYPAFTKWNFKYLTTELSEKTAKLTCFDVENNYARRELKNINYKNALELIQNNPSKKEKFYIMRQSLITDLPELSKDIFVPDWIGESTNHSPAIWIGESGNKTPLHYDSTQDLLIQIAGIKEIILFSKGSHSILEINNPFSGGRFNFNTIKFIENIPTASEDFFKNNAYRCVLKPGMILYIPRGWWHQVNSLTTSISANYYWNEKNLLALDTSCKNYILRYQATKLYEIEHDRDAFNLINNSNYDNIQETIEQFFTLKKFYFCVMLSGVIVQEMFSHLDKLFKIAKYDSNLDFFDFIQELTEYGGNKFFIKKEILDQWQRMIKLAFSEDHRKFTEKEVETLFRKIFDYQNKITNIVKNLDYTSNLTVESTEPKFF